MKLMAGKRFPFSTSGEAMARASRDVGKMAGVVAVHQRVDTNTGGVMGNPAILARHDGLPAEFSQGWDAPSEPL